MNLDPNIAIGIAKFSDLKGKSLKKITINTRDNYVLFDCEDTTSYILQHIQESNEEVVIEDTLGDLDDLIGTPLLLAKEINRYYKHIKSKKLTMAQRISAWSYYQLDTVKGTADIRWCGTCNGYYTNTARLYRVFN